MNFSNTNSRILGNYGGKPPNVWVVTFLKWQIFYLVILLIQNTEESAKYGKNLSDPYSELWNVTG
jgi:hypothetical protein